jgi:hypothetical protein
MHEDETPELASAPGENYDGSASFGSPDDRDLAGPEIVDDPPVPTDDDDDTDPDAPTLDDLAEFEGDHRFFEVSNVARYGSRPDNEIVPAPTADELDDEQRVEFSESEKEKLERLAEAADDDGDDGDIDDDDLDKLG